MLAFHAAFDGDQALVRVPTREAAERDLSHCLCAKQLRTLLHVHRVLCAALVVVVFDANCTSAGVVAPTHSNDLSHEHVRPRGDDAEPISVIGMDADSHWRELRVVREIEFDKDFEDFFDS